MRRATSECGFSRIKEKKESVYITLPQSANAVVTIRINIMQRNIDRNTHMKRENSCKDLYSFQDVNTRVREGAKKKKTQLLHLGEVYELSNDPTGIRSVKLGKKLERKKK